MIKRNYLLLTGCFIGLFGLQGCTVAGLALGAGAAAGVASVQEGGFSRATTDARIQTQINELWFSHDVDMFRKLDMTVNSGRVLLTGVVQDPEHRVEAVRLAWQPKGVEQVINEVTVADSDGVAGFARDNWITGRLRTALIWDKEVQSVNYSVDTVQRVVYLMGWAQDQGELNRVIEIARTLSDVERVVSYVKVLGEDSPIVSQSDIDSDYVEPAAVQRVDEAPAQSAPRKRGFTDANGERVHWAGMDGEEKKKAVDGGSAPVTILPKPAGYPNVQGHDPILVEPASGPSGVAKTSEDYLWNQ